MTSGYDRRFTTRRRASRCISVLRPCLAVAGMLWAAPAAPVAAQQRMVLTGATLIDGTGGPPVPDARVVVEGGRFTCVSGPEGCPARTGDEVLDLPGRWLTPGLIDTHIHLMYGERDDAILAREQRIRFALGITTARDAGSPAFERLLALRDTAADPAAAMPRLVVAARVTSEHAERYGVPMGAPLARHLVAMGADAIKIKPQFDDELWRETIRAAREAGVPAFGHAWAPPPHGSFVRAAVAEGLTGVSHLLGLVMEMQPPGSDPAIPDGTEAEKWAWLRDLWTTVDPAIRDTLIADLITAGVWLEPTLTHEYYWGRAVPLHQHLRFLGSPRRLVHLLPFVGTRESDRAPRFPETFARQLEFVRTFAARGGILVAGSDGVDPGLDLHEELRLIAAATGDPQRGLLAATRDAARALERPDLGTIEVNKVADAVVHDVDPLERSGTTTAIVLVIKEGRVHQGEELFAEFRADYTTSVREMWRNRLRRWLPPTVLLIGTAVAVAVMLRRRRTGAA